MPNLLKYTLITSFLLGCSSFSDHRISTIVIKRGILDRHTSYYCNNAIYVTKESVFEGNKKLSTALSFRNAGDISMVKITRLSKDEFLIEYLDNNKNVIGRRQYAEGTDFEIDNEGVVEIRKSSSCGSRNSPGFGCQWSTIRLFEDQSENLAVIQSDGGTGIVGIVPVAAGARYLSVFPHVIHPEFSLQETIPEGMLATGCPDVEAKAAIPSSATTKQESAPPFTVGDVLVPYRRYDHAQKTLIAGAAPGTENTKWKVVAITEKHVRLELVEGEYKPSWANGKTYKPGSYAVDFFSSINYKNTFPEEGNLGQVFDEFRKDN